MKAICRRDCYDNASRVFYNRGAVYDIERNHVLAKFFEFPPVLQGVKVPAPVVVEKTQQVANRFPKR